MWVREANKLLIGATKKRREIQSTTAVESVNKWIKICKGIKKGIQKKSRKTPPFKQRAKPNK